MKGKAECHTFSKQGVANFSKINWQRSKCPQCHYIKGQPRCTRNGMQDCTYDKCFTKCKFNKGKP